MIWCDISVVILYASLSTAGKRKFCLTRVGNEPATFSPHCMWLRVSTIFHTIVLTTNHSPNPNPVSVPKHRAQFAGWKILLTVIKKNFGLLSVDRYTQRSI